MSDITINLEIGAYNLPVRVKNPEEEVTIRKSAKILNSCYQKYRSQFPTIIESKLVTMSALEIINELIAENQRLLDIEKDNNTFLTQLKKELNLQ
jgi:cell division protein ZapA (FtsZ GTPase activity inhibitor)